MTLLIPLLCFLLDPAPAQAPTYFTWPCTPTAVEGVTLTLETDSREYFQGERIPVHMTYKAETEPLTISTRAYDRSGRLGDMVWHATRAADGLAAVDPYVGAFGGLSGGLTSGPELIRVGESRTQTFDLNEWLWFPEPGEYVVEVDSSRAQLLERDPKIGSYVVHSAPLRLTIRAATEADVQQVIARSRSVLEGPVEFPDSHSDPPPPDLRTNKQVAASDLRFLRDMAALPDYLELLGTDDLDSYGYFGLVGLPPEQSTLDAVWRKIRQDPDYSINWNTYGVVSRLKASLARGGKDTGDEREGFAKAIAEILGRKNPSARFQSMIFLGYLTNDSAYRRKSVPLLPMLEGDPDFARHVWDIAHPNDPEIRAALKAIRSKLSKSHAAILDAELAKYPD
jgi:hypothetical protein